MSESIPTLCWTLTIDESIHDYELAFGYFNNERTAAIFETVIGLDGVTSRLPVAFIPESVLAEALAMGDND
jgi:hypothetical protein|tara:strand:- start:196 stop:408 length:213 start_codon:yes stop_codon:yes gene_type:complete